MHQLKHHFCEYCSKKLTNWDEIRKHYYEKCPKYVVNCDNCEFIFSREDYLHHECIEHYSIREIELILYIATCLMQAFGIGVIKQFNVADCGLIGGARNFIAMLVPNVMFAFWMVCMWVNYTSI